MEHDPGDLLHHRPDLLVELLQAEVLAKGVLQVLLHAPHQALVQLRQAAGGWGRGGVRGGRGGGGGRGVAVVVVVAGDGAVGGHDEEDQLVPLGSEDLGLQRQGQLGVEGQVPHPLH